ncbi:MAG: cupin domain-containing protein [Micromonosporaceae bacterium]
MDVQPSTPATRGPDDWFTGEVRINPITSSHGPHQLSLGNVHFAPGARTAWHSHSIAQTLYVTEGEGLVQARGEEVIQIRPGEVINVKGASGTGTAPLPATPWPTCPSPKATPNGASTSPTPSTARHPASVVAAAPPSPAPTSVQTPCSSRRHGGFPTSGRRRLPYPCPRRRESRARRR